MRTVRILSSRDGHPCGAVVVVPEDVAQTWVGVGDAEYVASAAAPEAMVTSAPETAMRPSARPRRPRA